MADDETQAQEVRDQTSRIMKGAAEMSGSREHLAKHLGVESYLVAEWMAGISAAPYDVVNKAVDIIVARAIAKKPRN